MDETFQGGTVADPLITGIGSTCLTGAATSTAQFPACPAAQSGPVPPPGQQPGYLQLTDASGGQSGAVFLNRPVPSSAGIDATFGLFQYGDGRPADGISFFLVDGATDLTAPGGSGGSLGYAPLVGGSPGVAGGYIGSGSTPSATSTRTPTARAWAVRRGSARRRCLERPGRP